MRLVTTRFMQLADASKPLTEEGCYPTAEIGPGSYELDEIQNPFPKPPALDARYWCSTWLVIRGTKKGMSRAAFEHNYNHRRDPSVALIT